MSKIQDSRCAQTARCTRSPVRSDAILNLAMGTGNNKSCYVLERIKADVYLGIVILAILNLAIEVDLSGNFVVKRCDIF